MSNRCRFTVFSSAVAIIARAVRALVLLGLIGVSGLAAADGPGETFRRRQGLETNAPSRTSIIEDPVSGREVSVDADQVLVKFRKKITADEKAALVGRHGTSLVAKSTERLHRIGFARVRRPAGTPLADIVAALREEPVVSHAEADPVVRAFDIAPTAPSAAPSAEDPWPLDLIRARQAWNVTAGCPEVIVAVVDSGIDLDHPDLAGRLMGGRDFVGDSDSPDDDLGHGTAIAGVIAASGRRSGLEGIARSCRLMALRVLNARGEGRSSDVADAILHAADSGCRVINLSLGTYAAPAVLKAAVEYARSRNCVVVAAGGSDGARERCYPAALPGVIGVGAVDRSCRPCAFSNRGVHVDVSAPGHGIPSLGPGCRRQLLDGTSLAAAFVSGLAALVACAAPAADADAIRASIVASTHDLGSPGWDPQTGNGLIDCERAVQETTGTLRGTALAELEILPARPLPGQNAQIRVGLRNQGAAPEGPLNLRLLFHDSVVATRTVGFLRPKRVAVVCFEWRPPRLPGVPVGILEVEVDPLPGETRLEDNRRRLAVSFAESPIDDVAIRSCRVSGAPFVPGASVRIAVEVVNLGNRLRRGVSLTACLQRRPIARARHLDLPAGELRLVPFDWQIPPATSEDDRPVPLYVLSFALGRSDGEKDLENNRCTIVLGLARDPARVVPFHKVEGGQEVHQWIANEGFKYFQSQIDGADIGNYLGTIAGSHMDRRNNLLEGVAAEDKDDRPPLYQFLPFMRHFCAGADGGELFDGFLAYDSNFQQAQRIWSFAVDAYPGNKARAFYYLGHVAHLLGDLTVPAHTHNDEHPLSDMYEDTMGFERNYQLWRYGGGRSGAWDQPLTVHGDLYSLFYRTANYTEDYDSDDVDGDGPPYFYPHDYPRTWHRPQDVDRRDGEIDIDELTIIGDDLMPYAMRRSAELYRLFYREVDASPPVCTMTYPGSSDPVRPDFRRSAGPFEVTAAALDPQSGVLRRSYRVFYRYSIAGGWSDWTELSPSPGASSRSFTPPLEDTAYAFQAIAQNGGGSGATSEEVYLTVDVSEPQTPAILGYADANKSETLTSGEEYGHPNPYFEFFASDSGPAGIEGYLVFWGTDPTGVPAQNSSGTYEPSGLVPGQDYHLRVQARDRAHNLGAVSTFVYSYRETSLTCDVEVHAVNWSPERPVEGRLMSIDVEVGNDPDATTSTAVEVEFYLSLDGDLDVSDDHYVCTPIEPGLDPGETWPASCQFTFPHLGSGEYPVWIIVVLDPGGRVRCDPGPKLYATDPLLASDGIVNLAPLAAITSVDPDPAQPPDDEVRFVGTSEDPDGFVVAWEWSSHLDGTLGTAEILSLPSLDLTVGTHTVSFRARDNLGTWSERRSEELTILDGPPVAVIRGMSSAVLPDGVLVIDVAGHDNDERSATVVDGEITIDEAVHRVAVPGRHDLEPPGKPGLYTVLFRVRDDEGTWSPPVSETLRVLEPDHLEYFVAPTGNDTTNNGLSLEEPFATVQHAIDEARASEARPATIHVAPGVYREAAILKEWVTLRGAGHQVTAIISESADQSTLVGADHAVLEGLSVLNDGGAPSLSCDGSSPLVQGNAIGGSETGPRVLLRNSAAVLVNNLIGGGDAAVSVHASADARIINNTITASPFGIVTDSPVTVVNNVIVYVVHGLVAENSARPFTSHNVLWEVFGERYFDDATSAPFDAQPAAGEVYADPLFRNPFHPQGDASCCAVDFRLLDYRLQPGSPCIDAGTAASAPSVDSRGKERPCGNGVDVGPYEFCEFSYLRADANGDGTADVSDAVCILLYLFRGARCSGCLDAADANDDGAVDLADAVYSLRFLLMGGPEPLAPQRACGADPTADDLDCRFPPEGC